MDHLNMMCSMCHDKNQHYSYLNQLRMIKQMIAEEYDVSYNDYINMRNRLGMHDVFHAHFSCHYGMHCYELDRASAEIRSEGLQLEEDIVKWSISKKPSKVEYFQLLRLCQGYFPQAYRFVEKLQHINL